MRAFAIFAFLLLFALPATAQNLVAQTNQADIDRIEAYLNSFKTLESEFIQSSSNGGSAEGMVYLARPNKLRFQYKPPAAIELVADGNKLIFYDASLKQVSNMSVKSSPLYPILKEKVDLTDPSIALVRFSKAKGEISVSFVKRDDPASGEVTLQFSDSPLELRRWVIRDAQDVMTTVSLINTKMDVPIDPKTFVFNDPRPLNDRLDR